MKNHFVIAQMRLLGLAFVPAWVVGMLIMRLYSAPMTMPLMNLGAGIIGFVGVALGARSLSAALAQRPLPWAFAVLVTFLLTLVDRGLESALAGREDENRWNETTRATVLKNYNQLDMFI